MMPQPFHRIRFAVVPTWRVIARGLGVCAFFVTASCVEPKGKPPVEQAAPADQVPAFKKPVRMTGRGKITSISFEEFFELHQSGRLLLFDARPAYFHGQGHIPGALNLPKENCDARIHQQQESIKSALGEGKTIVVYCTNRLCPDARTVARHISGFGHPVSLFSAGWEAWQEAGLPGE